MKKFFVMMFALAALGLVCIACGDDKKDEPVVPTQNLESVKESGADTYYVFDIDMDKDSSSIYMYSIKFSDQMPVTIDVRIDAPVTVDKTGKVYTYAGTGIMPYMMRNGKLIPMPGEAYQVTDLLCNVNTEAKTYDIKFDCHGGHFEQSGKLK